MKQRQQRPTDTSTTKTCSGNRAIHRLGSADVYADLGHRDAWIMPVKAQLVSRIAELLAARRMPQTQAAILLGIPRPKLSMMLRGQFRGMNRAGFPGDSIS